MLARSRRARQRARLGAVLASRGRGRPLHVRRRRAVRPAAIGPTPFYVQVVLGFAGAATEEVIGGLPGSVSLRRHRQRRKAIRAAHRARDVGARVAGRRHHAAAPPAAAAARDDRRSAAAAAGQKPRGRPRRQAARRRGLERGEAAQTAPPAPPPPPPAARAKPRHSRNRRQRHEGAGGEQRQADAAAGVDVDAGRPQPWRLRVKTNRRP